MHDKMMKMLGKKRDLSENEKNAKMDVMKELRDSAAQAMHGKMGNMKKVSVMADSKDGLKEGLERAEDMMHSDGGEISNDEMDNMREKAEDDQSNSFGPEDEESAPDDLASHDMSPEDIDMAIAKLQEMKKQKMADGGPVLDQDKVKQFQQGFFGKK